MDDGALFPTLVLSAGLVDGLRGPNPWWEGKPGVVLPSTRRHRVAQLRRRLDARLPPIVVVRGPRQIGKTTAKLQLIADLLREGVPPRSILRFLHDTLLVRLVQPLEMRRNRRRSGPKIRLAAQAGHNAESVAGACLCTVSGLDVNHVPARDHAPEVDFVLTVGIRRISIEVTYQPRIRADDAAGLLSFVATRANGAEFGVLITQSDDSGLSDQRVVTLPLSTFLLLR
jgi:predicted AAA+ superfamily ATPase